MSAETSKSQTTSPKAASSQGVELLPCPFCGSPAQHEPWHGGSATKTMIQCSHFHDTCDVGPMVSGETYEEAADRWNCRARIRAALSAPASSSSAEAEALPAGVDAVARIICDTVFGHSWPETDYLYLESRRAAEAVLAALSASAPAPEGLDEPPTNGQK